MPRVSSRVCAVASALLAALGSLSGCRQSSPAPREIATFEGFADVETGTLTIRMLSGNPRIAAVQNIPVDTDGTRGSGPPGTVELVTNWAAYTDAGGNSVSTPAGEGCARPSSFCGNVTIRSFHQTQELHNIFVEITEMRPALSNLGYAKTAEPTGSQPGAGEVSATNGLWAYPALLDSTRGAIGGGAPGSNAASRTWYFDNFNQSSFSFRGRIMADPVAIGGGVTGYQATCGGFATVLGSVFDCGECNRTAPSYASCTWESNGGGTAATAAMNFGVNCDPGATPCDSADSMAWDCVDLNADENNCGVCGQVCPAGKVCQAKQCVTATVTCTVGSPCGTACCPTGSICVADACILDEATEVSVGRAHVCAATGHFQRPASSGGTPRTLNNIVCWGTGFHSTDSSSIGIALPEGTTVQVGNAFNLSSSRQGTVGRTDPSAGLYTMYLWGSGSADIATWFWFSDLVTLGNSHGCGARSGIPVGAYCWGDNTHGQLGINSMGGSCPSFTGCTVRNLANTDVGLYASRIAAGGDTTCAVLQDGTGVACWGDNTSGQAGTADTNTSYPHLVPDTSTASAVSVGAHHAVALVGTTTLVFWGSNASGAFGDGTNTTPSAGTTVQVTAVGPVDSVSAGQDFTCYTSGGTVYCAGQNGRGQLGDGTVIGRNTFAAVQGVPFAWKVSAGGVSDTSPLASACALTFDGTVHCWGDGSAGQLGDGVARVAPNDYSAFAVPVRLAKIPVN